MIKFEKVSRFANEDVVLPVRKTANSAGYDFTVAEEVVLKPYQVHYNHLNYEVNPYDIYSLEEVATATKQKEAKPTLVSTGVKCALEPDTYLELSVRSSTPLKYWIVLANGVGIIDADYYNNESNEGEIFFQLINLSPYPIRLKKGEVIGQGIIKKYMTTDDDAASGERKGGFGSTNE